MQLSREWINTYYLEYICMYVCMCVSTCHVKQIIKEWINTYYLELEYMDVCMYYQYVNECIFRKTDLQIVPCLFPLSCILEGILQKMIWYLVLRNISPWNFFGLISPPPIFQYSLKDFVSFGVYHTPKSPCSGDRDDYFVVKLDNIK